MELISECTIKAREILSKHKDKVTGLAEAVLKKETLNHQ
jgi:ATP-dependent Zn protease